MGANEFFFEFGFGDVREDGGADTAVQMHDGAVFAQRGTLIDVRVPAVEGVQRCVHTLVSAQRKCSQFDDAARQLAAHTRAARHHGEAASARHLPNSRHAR